MVAETKVKISGDDKSVQAAIGRTKRALGDLGGEINKIGRLAAGALSFAGIGLGARELVEMADKYGQLSARLRLVTDSQAEFNTMQKQLLQIANDTRAPLAETITLYGKLAPSVKSLGGSAAESADLVKTVSQAIALSGASAGASEAAVMQFGQALASGALRGDELNSILEQTPTLAKAIADGLGVPIGRLREMGAAGELTADKIIVALQRVAPQVDKDFGTLPVTVGQSFTLLGNSVLDFVGKADKATGATQAISDAVANLAKNLDIVAPVIGGVLTAALVAFVPRMLAAATAAARFAVAMAAANPIALAVSLASAAAAAYGLSVAMDAVKAPDIDIDVGQQIEDQKRLAERRIEIEDQVAKKRKEIESIVSGVQVKSIDSARKEALKSIDEQVKASESLKNALQRAWQESTDGARKAAEEAVKLRKQAGDARGDFNKQAAARRAQDLPPEEQQAKLVATAEKATNDANLNAAAAHVAAIDGRAQAAADYAEKAKKQIEEARDAVNGIQDNETAAKMLERLGEAAESMNKAQAKLKEGEAKQLTEQATAQQDQLDMLEKRLAALAAEAKAIKVEADTEQARKELDALEKQLANLTADKTITVRANTGNLSPAPFQGNGASGGFAAGGFTGLGGKYAPAGVVHKGEYVFPQEVVRRFGIDALRDLHLRGLRGYANGGLVGNLRVPSISAPPKAASSTPVVLDFGALGRYQASAAGGEVEGIERALRRAALKGGRR